VAIDPHLEPHWDTAALITIDMQRDMCGSASSHSFWMAARPMV
jgi:hypothetical protein